MMLQPDEFDVVELLRPIPKYPLAVGQRGTVLEKMGPDQFLIEFVDESGETLAEPVLRRTDLIVVWQARHKKWLPLDEQLAQLISILPETSRQEIFDFARFLTSRQMLTPVSSV